MQSAPTVRPLATITNALAALSTLADRGRISVPELAELLTLHERNALRLLLSLEVSGYAERAAPDLYVPGPALSALRAAVTEQHSER